METSVKGVQPIAFENAVWAYTLGTAVALKKGASKAADEMCIRDRPSPWLRACRRGAAPCARCSRRRAAPCGALLRSARLPGHPHRPSAAPGPVPHIPRAMGAPCAAAGSAKGWLSVIRIEVCRRDRSERYVRHPLDVVSVGDVVRVRVLEVDQKRGRISLTMKQVEE